MIPFVDLKTQYVKLKSQVQERINTVLEHGQYIMGPEVRELEIRLEEYTGAKHCITCASGTEALMMSLMALDIGAGDEVITTPFTFAATVETIVLLGAKPIFVDIERDTCNIDAKLIEAKITPRTKAIVPVSLYGQVSELKEINALAARHGNLPVIEDAAQSFGASYGNRKSCNLSTIGCTSFFPSKPLGCYGDGGAVFTNNDDLAKICREIRIHGQSARYVHTRVGLGGRMDTIQCAVVLAKFERFDWEVERRAEIGRLYNSYFDKRGIQRVTQRENRTSMFAQYTIFHESRALIQDSLKSAGIPTAIHYPVPMNQQPAYNTFCCPECTPVANDAAKRVISLPMHADLSDSEVNRICENLERVLDGD